MLSTYLAVCQKRGGLTCVWAFHYISSRCSHLDAARSNIALTVPPSNRLGLLRPARLRRVSNVRSDFQRYIRDA